MKKNALFVTGSARKIKKTVLLVLAVVLLLMGFKMFLSYLNIYTTGVAKDVFFWEENVGRWSETEVGEYVQEIAVRETRHPIDASVNLKDNRIIPDVSGLRIDIDATVETIMNARPGEKVLPVYRQITARVKWDDYPSLPAYQGNPAENCVSFMINVAWGEEHLEKVMEVLKNENVKATFFITGKWAEKNTDWIKKIDSAGHELANHGYSDAMVMTQLQHEEIEDSLLSTNELLFNITGKEVNYFTPHKGEYNDLVLEIVARNYMRTVMWSLDTVDWSDPGLDKMEAKIVDNVSAGDIILMHPTKDIPELLMRIIPFIREQGLHILTVEDHLSSFPYF